MPVLDTAFAIVRRARGRQGLATADKDHLHHRLVRLGHGHRRSVGILWAWTALLSAFVLYPIYNAGQGDGIVPIGVGALALLLYTLFHPGIQAERMREPVAGWATPPTLPEEAVADRTKASSNGSTEPQPPTYPAPIARGPGRIRGARRPTRRRAISAGGGPDRRRS